MRTTSFLRLSILVALGVLGGAFTACGGTKPDSGFENGDGGGLGSGEAGGAFGGDGSGGGGGGNQAGCSDAAKLVYVVDSTNGLHSFDPATLRFASLGVLNCPSPGKDSVGGKATPNSMAVDRSGMAWVNFTSGKLFKVSTTDASCTGTSYDPGNDHSVWRWGMAFSSNSVGSTDETLFAVPNDGAGNGTGVNSVDTSALTLTPLGNFTSGLDGQAAELTGTGNAELYGFVTTSPATLAKVDKSSGATPMSDQVSLTGVETGVAFAFSFWGGDFWFYTSQDGFSSQVTQYKASGDKSINVVVDDTGFAIVGAGVSTCAPTAPPR